MTALRLVFAATLLLVSTALPSFLARIPNGGNPDLMCNELGHNGCQAGAPRNSFGLDFQANGLMYDVTLCQMDSDGDGLTNGEELGDPCCLWTQDNPTPLRTNVLSHPGDATDTRAIDAPPTVCPTPPGQTPPPPTATPTPTPATATPTMVTMTPAPTMVTVTPTPTKMIPKPVPTGFVPDDMKPPKRTPQPYPTGFEEEDGDFAPPMLSATPSASYSPTPSASYSPTPSASYSPSPSASYSPGFTASPSPSASVSPTPTPTGVLGQAAQELAQCFSGESTVLLKDGSRVYMKDLKVGDEVLSSFPSTFSQVYFFSHKEADGSHDFVRLTTENGRKITATKGHYIHVDGKLKAAGSIVAGDRLVTEDGESVIVEVADVTAKGLYNPHTLSGSIIVDGVMASDVTTAVNPALARSLLAPLKLSWKLLRRDVSGGYLNGGWSSMAAMLPNGAKEL